MSDLEKRLREATHSAVDGAQPSTGLELELRDRMRRSSRNRRSLASVSAVVLAILAAGVITKTHLSNNPPSNDGISIAAAKAELPPNTRQLLPAPSATAGGPPHFFAVSGPVAGIWDSATGELLQEVGSEVNATSVEDITTAARLPNGNFLLAVFHRSAHYTVVHPGEACSGTTQLVEVQDTGPSSHLISLTVPGQVEQVAVSPDSTRIAIVGWDFAPETPTTTSCGPSTSGVHIVIRDLKSGAVLNTLYSTLAHPEGPQPVSWSKDDQHLAVTELSTGYGIVDALAAHSYNVGLTKYAQSPLNAAANCKDHSAQFLSNGNLVISLACKAGQTSLVEISPSSGESLSPLLTMTAADAHIMKTVSDGPLAATAEGVHQLFEASDEPTYYKGLGGFDDFLLRCDNGIYSQIPGPPRRLFTW